MNVTQFEGFNSFQPLVSTGAAGAYATNASDYGDDQTKSKSGDTSLGGLDSKMVEWLYKQGGLTSDVQKFLTDMQFAIDNAYNPVSGKPNLGMYKLLIPQLNQIREEKEAFKKAEEVLIQKNAINDYAITSDGRIFALWEEDGKLQQDWITSKDYMSKLQEGQRIRILTNGELAKYRRNDISQAFNSDISVILQGATGMEDIIKFIKQSAPQIGKTTQEQTVQQGQGVSQQTIALQESAQVLTDMLNGVKVSQKDTSSQNQAALALNYLMGTMPTNMRVLLDLKAADTNQTAMSLIESYIGAGLNEEHSTYISQQGDKKTAAQQAKEGISKMKMSAPMQWLAGLGQRDIVTIQKGTIDGLALSANNLALKINNKNVGLIPLDQVGYSDFGDVLDMSQVSTAGMMVAEPNTKDIVVQGGALYKMELPYDVNFYNQTGQYKPDFEFLPKIREAEKIIREKKIDPKDYKSINEVYRSQNIPVKYEESGNRSLTAQYKTFGVMNGYVNDIAFGDDHEDPDISYIKELKDKNLINNIMAVLNEGKSEDDRKSFSFSFWGADTMYETTIFIPVKENYFNALASSDITISQANDYLEPLQHSRDAAKQYNFVSGGMPGY